MNRTARKTKEARGIRGTKWEQCIQREKRGTRMSVSGNKEKGNRDKETKENKEDKNGNKGNEKGT